MANYLKDLRQLLLEGKIEEVIGYIQSIFPGLLEEYDDVMKVLHIQQFIEYIKIKDQNKALQYAQKNLTKYQKSITYCLDEQGIPKEAPIDVEFYSFIENKHFRMSWPFYAILNLKKVTLSTI